MDAGDSNRYGQLEEIEYGSIRDARRILKSITNIDPTKKACFL